MPNKKIRISFSHFLGTVLLLSVISALMAKDNTLQGFINTIFFGLFVYAVTACLLLFSFGKDFLKFIPSALLSLVVKYDSPTPVYAKICLLGRRYTLGAGTFCSVYGIILMLRNLSNPGTIGEGMAMALSGVIYGLIAAEFFFTPLFVSYSEETSLEETGKEKASVFHLTAPVLLLLLVLLSFFALLADLAPGRSSYRDDSSIISSCGEDEIVLKKITANIRDTAGARYIMISIAVKVSDPSLSSFFEIKSSDTSQGEGNLIKSKITEIISDKTMATLLSAKGRYTLAQEIKNLLNETLQEKNQTKEKVLDVYFPSFLVE